MVGTLRIIFRLASYLLHSPLKCINSFEKEIKLIDVAILKTVKGLNPVEYQVLNSIPGIGPVFSAGILAEIGSINVCSITICLYNGTLRNLLPPILISMTSS